MKSFKNTCILYIISATTVFIFGFYLIVMGKRQVRLTCWDFLGCLGVHEVLLGVSHVPRTIGEVLP